MKVRAYVLEKVNPKELAMGTEIEKEHTDNPEIAKKIAQDHLAELPDYYSRLKKMEKKSEVQEGGARGISKHVTSTDSDGSGDPILRTIKVDDGDGDTEKDDIREYVLKKAIN